MLLGNFFPRSSTISSIERSGGADFDCFDCFAPILDLVILMFALPVGRVHYTDTLITLFLANAEVFRCTANIPLPKIKLFTLSPSF